MKEIKQLLSITNRLKNRYGGILSFSLDGRLVGDIGEALVSELYDIELYGTNVPHYDGVCRKTNKKVQIKASMKYNFSYPFGIDLEHYIAVHIRVDGNLDVIYNGPGKPIHDFLKQNKRKPYRNIWYGISTKHLQYLNSLVQDQDRLQVVSA